jgi:hypothetical protein
MFKGLLTTKPTQEPQVKKGEQPGHSFSLEACLSIFPTDKLSVQSLSEQQGFAERIIT